MLRTAQEIINDTDGLDYQSDGYRTTYTTEDVIRLINIGRKEVIEVCEEIHKTADRLLYMAYNNNHDDMGWDVDYQSYIDGQYIHSLIDELK